MFYRCDSGPTYNKEQISSSLSLTHSRECKFPAFSWRALIRKNKPSRLPFHSLGSHSGSVDLGFKNNSARLLASVGSQATLLQRRYSKFCSGQQSARSLTRSANIACKRHCGNSALSEQRVRLFQPLLPRSKERWRAQTHSRSQTSEPLTYALVVKDVNYQTDPRACLPRGLVFDSGPERCILSHPHSPHHRPFLRFAFEGVAYQYTILPFGLSLAPRTFTKCVDAALSPLRQMGIRILNYLDNWQF